MFKKPSLRLSSLNVCRHRAFTLVELLVVITVISILAVLTFGAVKNVLTSAQRTGCAANLRKVGQAILLYASDNDGSLPGNGNGAVGPQYVRPGVPNRAQYGFVAIELAPYIPDSVWSETDPNLKKSMSFPTTGGAVWGKPAPSGQSSPLDANAFPFQMPQAGQRLVSFPNLAKTEVLHCLGVTDPSDGRFYWAHPDSMGHGKLNYLYLDDHIEVVTTH